MARPFEVVTDQFGGDPFLTLVAIDDKDDPLKPGKYYLVDEAALIEVFERNNQTFLENLFKT